MVASSPQPSIPTGATAGEFARVVGVTERVIAGRKADGRLPKLSNGSIDLHAVIRAGTAALAHRPSREAGPDMDPAEAYDAALRIGANIAARLALSKALGLPLDEAMAHPMAEAAFAEACEMLGVAQQAPA